MNGEDEESDSNNRLSLIVSIAFAALCTGVLVFVVLRTL